MTHSKTTMLAGNSLEHHLFAKVGSGTLLFVLLTLSTGAPVIATTGGCAVRAAQHRLTELTTRAEQCYAKLRTAYEIAVGVDEAERQQL